MRGSFSPSEVQQLREASLRLRQSEDPSFSKMVEGCPNFWRDITDDTAKKYAVNAIKKASYFFPWNPTSSELFQLVYPRWRIAKLLGGKDPLSFETNTPIDGPVDRIQIVEYPPGTGQIEPHKDAKNNQRLVMSCYLSKRGEDYQGGGFWVLQSDGSKRNLEDDIALGDMGFCYAEITHGVDASNVVNAYPWDESSKSAPGSRWFLGLFTPDSDATVSRKTSTPIQLD